MYAHFSFRDSDDADDLRDASGDSDDPGTPAARVPYPSCAGSGACRVCHAAGLVSCGYSLDDVVLYDECLEVR
jgi:hypothetical protein